MMITISNCARHYRPYALRNVTQCLADIRSKEKYTVRYIENGMKEKIRRLTHQTH